MKLNKPDSPFMTGKTRKSALLRSCMATTMVLLSVQSNLWVTVGILKCAMFAPRILNRKYGGGGDPSKKQIIKATVLFVCFFCCKRA